MSLNETENIPNQLNKAMQFPKILKERLEKKRLFNKHEEEPIKVISNLPILQNINQANEPFQQTKSNHCSTILKQYIEYHKSSIIKDSLNDILIENNFISNEVSIFSDNVKDDFNKRISFYNKTKEISPLMKYTSFHKYFSLSSTGNIFTESDHNKTEEKKTKFSLKRVVVSNAKKAITKYSNASDSGNKHEVSSPFLKDYVNRVELVLDKSNSIAQSTVIDKLIANPREAELIKYHLRAYHLNWKYKNFFHIGVIELSNLKYILFIMMNKSFNNNTEIDKILFKCVNTETGYIFYQYVPLSEIYPMKQSIELGKLRNKYRFLIDLLEIEKGTITIKRTKYHKNPSIINSYNQNISIKENSYINKITNEISNNFISDILEQPSIINSLSKDFNEMYSKEINDFNLSSVIKGKDFKDNASTIKSILTVNEFDSGIIEKYKEIFNNKFKIDKEEGYLNNKEIIDDISVANISYSSDSKSIDD